RCSRPPTSQPTAVPRTPPCSTCSTSTGTGSSTSRWATPRRWPGCSSSSCSSSRSSSSSSRTAGSTTRETCARDDDAPARRAPALHDALRGRAPAAPLLDGDDLAEGGRQGVADATPVDPQPGRLVELPGRADRAAVQLLLPEHGPHRRPGDGRHGPHLDDGRLRVRAAALPRTRLPLHARAGDDDAAERRHADPDVPAVQTARLVEHAPTAHRAVLAGRHGLLHLSEPPVLPGCAVRARRGGAGGWRLQLPHLRDRTSVV